MPGCTVATQHSRIRSPALPFADGRPQMEYVLVVLVLALFGLVFAARGRISALAAEVARLRHDLGEQGAELNRLLEIVEARQSRVATAPAEAARLATAAPTRAARPPRRQRSSIGPIPPPPPDPGGRLGPAIEPVRDVLDEMVPGAAVASAAVDVARRPRRPGPTPFERWLQELRTTEEWEALIGGRLLNRIGAAALILGIAFFFKYAVDQNWINQGLRVICGLLLGSGLLALASRSHKRGYAIFGQGLVGAGLATLYLSVYASFNFYHLVPQPAALTGMGIITALAFLQAVYYDSLAVSLLACLGGYLTPFLLSSPGSGPVGTIVYVLLLDVGTLAVLARKRSWMVLEPIALGATYITYFTWYISSYSSDRMVLAAIAVSLFWALFLVFDVSSLLVFGVGSSELRHTLGVVNGLAYYGALFALIGRQHHGWMAALTLLIGSLYVGALFAVKRRNQLSTGIAVRYTVTAMILLVVATAIRFTGFTVVILWSLEALPLVFFGTRWKTWYVWRPALAVYALAVGLLFATPGALAYAPIESFRPLLNERALAYLVLAGTLAASAMAFRPLRPGRTSPEFTAIEQSLQYGWAVLTFILLGVETVDLFRRLAMNASVETTSALQFGRSLTVATVWMAYSLPLVWFGLRRSVRPWITVGLGSSAAGVSRGCMGTSWVASPPPMTSRTSSPEQNAGSAPVMTRHRAVVPRTARSNSS